jgi:16S rRNA (guanine527-N7)-methyltransferase
MLELTEIFLQGLKALALKTPVESLSEYVSLLEKWNRAINLTAIRSSDEVAVKHILDSLSIAPLIAKQEKQILDVGSGAGFPGVPLALSFANKNFSLLDSNGKKTAFLLEAKRVLALKNMSVINSRVEAYRSEAGFDIITCRAFSSMNEIVTSTKHLLAAKGRWLLMRGAVSNKELSGLNNYDVEVVPLKVPFLDASRHCISIRA